MDGGGGWGVSEPSPGPDHLRRLPFLFFFVFLLGDYADVQSGAGAPRGGGRRLESEKRGKRRWRVCQGSATDCTSNPGAALFLHQTEPDQIQTQPNLHSLTATNHQTQQK